MNLRSTTLAIRITSYNVCYTKLLRIQKLLGVLQRLVDAGNSVVIIEHNLDVIKMADHVIDLGPEGGSRGGTVIASGTPEEVARSSLSHTGRYLRACLDL